MSRKTIKVLDVKNSVNAFLMNSRDSMTAERQGAMNVLEGILHSTDNYCGFMYMNADHMAASTDGSSVGIHNVCYTEQPSSYATKFANTDNTRVVYF